MFTDGLNILLLGGLDITIAGEPVSGLVSQKAKALLAYLAAQQRPISRSKLAGLMWSDLPEEDARRNLRVEISKLRQWLEPHLLVTRQEMHFKPGANCRVDLIEFENHLAALRRQISTPDKQQLDAAAALYRGDFLSGFQIRGAPLFEEWLLLERERLRQGALELLDQLVEAAIQAQDWETGQRAARKSLAIDGWRETSHRQLMVILARSGDRSGALAQFETARRILVQELGIEPGSETSALYQQIKAGEFAPPGKPTPPASPQAAPPPHNLPAPTTSFVGRETELAQLSELLHDPGCRLLTLIGPGGIGKTRLALELGWKVTRASGTAYQDGVYLIPLAAIDQPDLLAESLLETLHIPGPGTRDPLDVLIEHLSSRQVLLILDNFEQLVEAAPTLVKLLHSAPGVKLLVTSRHQLNLYEEWVFPVDGLPYPQPDDLTHWQEYTAAKLFLSRARQVNLRFAPEPNRDCIIHICRLLDGLPLGIELAAAWAQVLPCENIARLILQNLSLPEDQTRNRPSRQKSLQAVFQYSWDLLTPEEQKSLARISVFQGGFSLPAAEKVANANPRLLASLAAKSLLRFSPDGWYETHQLLHTFTAAKLSPADHAATQAAHSRYFAQFLSERARDFAGPQESQAIDDITTHISNIRAGWFWAVAQILESAGSSDLDALEPILEQIQWYIPTLSTFYFRKSWFREAEPLFRQAANRMEAAGFDKLTPESKAPLVLGLVYLAHARHLRVLGQNKAALEQITKGVKLLSLFGDSPELADAWHSLGQIEQQTGGLANAEAAYQNSLRLYRELGAPTGIASNLISLGVLAKNRGDLSQATLLYDECKQIFEARGDQRGIWTCLINLGNIANVRQDFAQAKSLYTRALTFVSGSGDLSRQALTLLNLGSVAREVAEIDLARQYYLDSLRISEEIGEARIQTASLDGLGKTSLNEGDTQAAVGYLLRAMETAQASRLLPQALDSLASLGRVAAGRKKGELAGAILAYVLAQPACPDHVRQMAEADLERLKTQVAGDAYAFATQKYKDLPLDAVLDDIRQVLDG
jgi:DNA-binding SARP family transcriptional activator/predicted ATPase